MTLFLSALKSLGIPHTVLSSESSHILKGADSGVKISRQVFCFKGDEFIGIYTDLS